MKIIQTITIALILLFGQIIYGQALEVNETQKLAEDLNATISSDIHLSFQKNEGLLKFSNLNKKLDVRATSAIARDSMSKKEIEDNFYSSGRYIGSIFWQFDFEPCVSSKTSFRANSFGQLFFTLTYSENDAISIKSRLNEFSSASKISDSQSHNVQWTGEKYISVLLQPKKLNDRIVFSVRGITISGKFERKDQKDISRNYTKTLRELLKREFQKLFKDIELNPNTPSNNRFEVLDLMN